MPQLASCPRQDSNTGSLGFQTGGPSQPPPSPTSLLPWLHPAEKRSPKGLPCTFSTAPPSHPQPVPRRPFCIALPIGRRARRHIQGAGRGGGGCQAASLAASLAAGVAAGPVQVGCCCCRLLLKHVDGTAGGRGRLECVLRGMRLPGRLPHWRCHLPAGARPSPPPRRPVHLWGLGGGADRCRPHRRRLSGWVCPAPSREESWERVCLGDPGPKAPAEAGMPSAWVKLVNCVCVREKV